MTRPAELSPSAAVAQLRALIALLRARRRRAAVLALFADPLADLTRNRGTISANDPAAAPNLPLPRSLPRAMNVARQRLFSRNLKS